MPRRGSLGRRSGFEWAVRAGLAAIIAIAGYLSLTRTLGYTLRNADVERAHLLAPGDGRITALLAEKLTTNAQATPADRARATRLGQAALRQDPTSALAASALGINADVRKDTAAARRLFTYAETLSRRDLQTQLWEIEDSVGRGDVAAAVRHYDIALRTSANASSLLFPVLGSALAGEPVRAALIKALAQGPEWTPHFIAYAAGEGSDPQAAAKFFTELRQARVPVAGVWQAALVNHLISNGFMDDAWSYYATTHAGADRRRSRDPRFSADPSLASLFDWTPINEAGITTSIQHNRDDGFFAFSMPSSVGGTLLQQMQMMPAGTYQLDGRSIGIDQPETSRPYWVLTCRNGRELGRVAVPNSAIASGRFSGRVSVPPDCPVQTLALVAIPSDAIAGASGEIHAAQLRPIG